MKMKIISKEKRLCTCCMEVHEVKQVVVKEKSFFKNVEVAYDAWYTYCDKADEFYMDEAQMSKNDMDIKNAYRKLMGLLTSDEIMAVRNKYGITQSDLCILLGWGGKTVTRYEGHQVQDKAHDLILRKIDSDPDWYLSLLKGAREQLKAGSYEKYYQIAKEICNEKQKEAREQPKCNILPDAIKRNKGIMKLKKELDLALQPTGYFCEIVPDAKTSSPLGKH